MIFFIEAVSLVRGFFLRGLGVAGEGEGEDGGEAEGESWLIEIDVLVWIIERCRGQ